MLCHDCTSTIEKGRNDGAPVLARFCLKCRAERRRHAWLSQHDAYLRAHYHGGLHQRSRVIRELVRQTGFPHWYIKRQARRLGLSMTQDRRPWTHEELEILDRLLGKVSAATIARRLKRTETSVVMKIKAIGHSRRVSEGCTMRDLEECLGEDHHKIQKWIANGCLRDRLQGTRRHNGNGHDIHRFSEKDLLAFIRRHPEEINLGKVDQLWFLDLLLLRGMELRETVAEGRNRRDSEDWEAL